MRTVWVDESICMHIAFRPQIKSCTSSYCQWHVVSYLSIDGIDAFVYTLFSEFHATIALD